ncbi:hypothetical protein B0J13DRAFT_297465 [Dactylonectria estremocensis]|uniref:Uncharacterized protein n=1 Tax=Dactylonectria estremocensis TaxID=1079267 RepID=A0A9P9EZ09_9HYPO|nr:hypothetical protein B0J13DRAFT_297465 [Dactylonectria estremocensis]
MQQEMHDYGQSGPDYERLIRDEPSAKPRDLPKDLRSLSYQAFKLTLPLVVLLSLYLLVTHFSSGSSSGSRDGKFSSGLETCALLGTFLNITIYKNESLAPSPLPASHAASDGEQIIQLFQSLSRSTVWKSVANISFEGDTFEPEGMVRLGDDRYVISCGEYTEHTKKYGKTINGTDRTAGQGFAHLMVYNGKGERIADASITKKGESEYHNGGLDFDGEFVWGTIGQYRPNSTAYIYRADPATLEPEQVLQYADHLGGIVHDYRDKVVTTLNWGARDAVAWDLKRAKTGCDAKPNPKSTVRNPSHFVDYQDCKWLGHSKFYDDKSVMLCSGVATIGGDNLGGIALVDAATMTPLAEVPVALESSLGVRLTQNPVDLSVKDGKLRFYWMPDQHNSTLYIYEAQPDSPF